MRWWAALRALARREPWLCAITLVAALYVAAAICPSSYALILNAFEVADNGLYFGWPQWIRGDEYAVWTPTLQSAVNNDFGPVNLTSFYAEKLRTLSALPLADWGLIFKPQFWGFFLLAPAYGFSAYHAFHFWAFLLGWDLFLRRLGVGRLEAALAAQLLLWCSWNQLWWTSLASILTFAPLFVLPLVLPLRPLWRALLAFYITTAWLLDGIFYPPLYVGVSLAALLAIFTFRPEALRPGRLVSFGAGALAGVGMAAFYHWESLQLTLKSTVHGSRNVGGGGFAWQDWAGTFLPSLPYHGWRVMFGLNSCETSSAGSILWLLIVVFVLPSSLLAFFRDAESRRRLWRSFGLVALFVAASIWYLAPVPAVWGKLLLWNLTIPSRLLVLPGLTSLFVALLFLPRLELRWSVPRALFFSAIVVFVWSRWERWQAPEWSLLKNLYFHGDLALVPLIFALPLIELILRRLPSSIHPAAAAAGEPAAAPAGTAWWWRSWRLSPATLLAAAAAANFFFFGMYNPIQSSRAIFAQHDSPKLRGLRVMQEADPRGWLVMGGAGYFGSVLSGFGFRAVNHALPNPEVARLAPFFRHLSKEELDKNFNRYLNVQITPYRPPRWRQPLFEPYSPSDNTVLLPPEPFLPKLDIRLVAEPPAGLPAAPGGTTRALTIGKRWWNIEVIGPVAGLTGEVAIEVHTDPPARRLIRHWRMPTVNGTEDVGLDIYKRLLIEMAASTDQLPAEGFGWCIILHDKVAGTRQIGPAPGAGRSTCR